MSEKLTGVYVNGVKVKDICSSQFAPGEPEEDLEPQSIYGFPPTDMNPHDFSPDRECCTPEEIAAWKAACDVWDAR